MPECRPNVLWLMTDEQRCDSLGCYGSPWARTPTLDRLAAEGTVFRQAVTPAPVCIPARLAMLTGRYPHETGVWNNLPSPQREHDHLTFRFAEAGYRTATFGKQHYAALNPAFQAEDRLILTDAVHYFHYAEQYDPAEFDVVRYPGPWQWIFGGRFPEPAQRTSESVAVDHALDWLDTGDPDRPWLLRVSFNGPHTPVVPPAPFDTLIDPDEIALPLEAEGQPDGEPAWLSETLRTKADAGRLKPDQVRRMRQCYYGEVAWLDTQFARLLDRMRERGLLDNTIIAFVADHGTHLGDYRMVQKQTFYQPSVRVPLVLHWPGVVAEGRAIETPVETVGLLPALVELAGLGDCEQVAGRRLLAAAGGCEPDPQPVFSEFTLSQFEGFDEQRIAMVRDGRWKLSRRWSPEPCDGTLHDLEADPYERTNLYGLSEHRDIRERLLGALERHLAT